MAISIPTFVPSTGAGTGATATVDGEDAVGTISLTTGLSPVLDAVIGDLVFDGPYAVAPKTVLLTPGNVTATAANVNVWVPVSLLATTKFSLKNTAIALLPSTVYIWYFKINCVN